MALIIDLSCIITKHPISRVFDAFTALCDRYAPPGACTPSVLQHPCNNIWVAYQYTKHEMGFIQDYRLGKVTTEKFLEALRSVFHFLDEETLIFDSKTIKELMVNNDQYDSLRKKSIDELKSKDFVDALLEEAWNSMVEIKELNLFQFTSVQAQAFKRPVYLTCNSNELHLNKLIRLLRSGLPSDQFFAWQPKPLKKDGLIELAPNLYVVSSHRQHTFKTQRDFLTTNPKPQDFLERLLLSLKEDKQNIEVISKPYSNLQHRADQLGIPKENQLSSETYFPSALPRKKWR